MSERLTESVDYAWLRLVKAYAPSLSSSSPVFNKASALSNFSWVASQSMLPYPWHGSPPCFRVDGLGSMPDILFLGGLQE